MCDHFYNLFLLFLYCSWSPSARLDELLYIIGNLRIENRNRQMGENKGLSLIHISEPTRP